MCILHSVSLIIEQAGCQANENPRHAKKKSFFTDKTNAKYQFLPLF